MPLGSVARRRTRDEHGRGPESSDGYRWPDTWHGPLWIGKPGAFCEASRTVTWGL